MSSSTTFKLLGGGTAERQLAETLAIALRMRYSRCFKSQPRAFPEGTNWNVTYRLQQAHVGGKTDAAVEAFCVGFQAAWLQREQAAKDGTAVIS